jgi:hypothetical protein
MYPETQLSTPASGVKTLQEPNLLNTACTLCQHNWCEGRAVHWLVVPFQPVYVQHKSAVPTQCPSYLRTLNYTYREFGNYVLHGCPFLLTRKVVWRGLLLIQTA